jgi:polysaccharide export outer membrane protein
MSNIFKIGLFLLAALILPETVSFAQGIDQDDAMDYQIRAGDKLNISVWGEDKLDGDVLVRPDGGISFPLAGEIRASGKTVAELNAAIKKNISRYIPEAEILVSIIEIAGNKIYVIGQVQRPGAIIMNPRLDVMQALSIAGGTTPFAALGDIKILRRSGSEQESIPFNYSEVIKGRNLEQNRMLEPGDVVVVP